MDRTVAVLAAGEDAGLHVGAQLHVVHDGRVVGEVARGLAAPGRPMDADSMMTWLSCSKIALSVLFARVWQERLVGLDDPVATHIPEFAAHGKGAVTVRQVWTHTCALLNAEERLFPVRYGQSHADNIALICASSLDRGRVPGRDAGYQTTAVPLLLAEIAARARGRDVREMARDEVFVPLGMSDSWLGMPEEALERYAERLGETYDTSGPEPVPGSWAPDRPHQLTHTMPGGNGRGPMRELARLLEMLRRGGELDGARILDPVTVAAMTARHRTGLHDRSWGQVLDWGLGLTLDSKVHHAGGTHLYGYGPYASPRTFGHAGFRTTLAFCDPETALVVTCSWNGMVADDDVHSARQNALCAAIYEDLDLAAG